MAWKIIYGIRDLWDNNIKYNINSNNIKRAIRK